MTTIRLPRREDLGDCLKLSRQAGWNQSAADWSRFLDLGHPGCFVAERDNAVVGTVTTCRFGDVGWVSMLLVEASCRGAGIGRNLFTKAIAYLDDAGTRSIRLDATPLGKPLYESLGFRVDFELARFAGTLHREDSSPHEDFLIPREPKEIAKLDREVTRTDRGSLIARLLHDAPESCRAARGASGEWTGYLLWREGASAVQIGPCGAEAEVGPRLLDAAAVALEGRPALVDLPLSQTEAVAWARRVGLQPVRPFWRMTRGEPIIEDLPRLWASSGAELG